MHDVSGAFCGIVCVCMGRIGTIQIARLANRPVGQFIAGSSLRAVAVASGCTSSVRRAHSHSSSSSGSSFENGRESRCDQREEIQRRTADGQMNRVDTVCVVLWFG